MPNGRRERLCNLRAQLAQRGLFRSYLAILTRKEAYLVGTAGVNDATVRLPAVMRER